MHKNIFERKQVVGLQLSCRHLAGLSPKWHNSSGGPSCEIKIQAFVELALVQWLSSRSSVLLRSIHYVLGSSKIWNIFQYLEAFVHF